LFFAETCFGDQLAFQYEKKSCRAILFGVDTFQVFIIADQFDKLFTEVLAASHALVEPDHLRRVWKRIGSLPDGLHYAPILSPLLGGTAKASNWHLETPKVHVVSAMAAFRTYQMR
jgi:hypothetical protein